jgi:hypothetical protein
MLSDEDLIFADRRVVIVSSKIRRELPTTVTKHKRQSNQRIVLRETALKRRKE